MTKHETLARQIASDPGTMPLHTATSARQGDLLLRRVAHEAEGPADFASVLLVAGRHGQHWAVGLVRLIGDILHVGHSGAVVAHTDVPTARHRAIALAPGCWQVGVQRELGVDQVIRKVVD